MFPAAILAHAALDFIAVTANARLPVAAMELLVAAFAAGARRSSQSRDASCKFRFSRSRVTRWRRIPSPTVWVPSCIRRISSMGTPSFRRSLIRPGSVLAEMEQLEQAGAAFRNTQRQDVRIRYEALLLIEPDILFRDAHQGLHFVDAHFWRASSEVVCPIINLPPGGTSRDFGTFPQIFVRRRS